MKSLPLSCMAFVEGGEGYRRVVLGNAHHFKADARSKKKRGARFIAGAPGTLAGEA